jgi:hypothetical protein
MKWSRGWLSESLLPSLLLLWRNRNHVKGTERKRQERVLRMEMGKK